MNAFYIIFAASPVLLLGTVAFVVFVAVGVRKANCAKRLIGKPRGIAESFARRVLTGSRHFGTSSESED